LFNRFGSIAIRELDRRVWLKSLVREFDGREAIVI